MSNPIKTPASAATERILSLTNHLKDSLDPADDIQKEKNEHVIQIPRMDGSRPELRQGQDGLARI
jgi:hypothetical protein